MAKDVLLPQWGMEMEEGLILKWIKNEGETVEEGDSIVEIETAKLTSEMESPASGILAHILVPEGVTIPVRTRMAIIAEHGETVPRPDSLKLEAVSGNSEQIREQPVAEKSSSVVPELGRQITPVARRLAKENQIDLDSIPGTGPNGRVTEDDVRRYVESEPIKASEELVGVRRTIADRMMLSSQTMAPVTLTTTADITETLPELDGLVNGANQQSTMQHLVIAATARNLTLHPRMNSTLKGYELMIHQNVNIGIAVAAPKGLLVPVLKDADQLRIGEIAKLVKSMVSQAYRDKLTIADLSGGTFTISSLGAYEVDAFTPIINPPQVGILGVGRILERPTVRNGSIVIGAFITLSVTFDHRALDGMLAAEFLSGLKGDLEHAQWITE